MRVFIGYALPSDMTDDLLRATAAARDAKGIVPERNMHMTLVFIGNAEEKDVQMLLRITESAASVGSDFEAAVDGTVEFKKGKVNAALVKVPERVYKAREYVISLLAERGISVDNTEYVPHITLRRGGGATSIEYGAIDRGKKYKMGEPLLFESKRVDGELRYIPITGKEV